MARRDISAVEILTKSISAMNGQSVTWKQVTDAVLLGSCSSPVQAGNVASKFRWTTRGKEFRYETDTDNAGPIYLSAHGKPTVAGSSSTFTLASDYGDKMRPYHVPGLTLQMSYDDDKAAVIMIGPEQLAGTNAVHIRIYETFANIKRLASEQDWWFDPATSLPLKVEYKLPTQVDSHYARLSWTFGAWSPEVGLLVPHRLRQEMDRELHLQDCEVSGVSINSNPPDSLFEGRL